MEVECPQCGSMYRVPEERIPDTGGRVTCTTCGHGFVVRADSGSEPAGLEGLAHEMEGMEEDRSVSQEDPTAVQSAGAMSSLLGDRGEDPIEEDATVEMRNPPVYEEEGAESEAREADSGEAEMEPTTVLGRDELDISFDDGESEGGGIAGASRGATESGGAAPLGGSSEKSGARATGGAATGPPADHGGPWRLRAEHGLTYEFPDTAALRDWLSDRDEVRELELSADGSDFRAIGEFAQFGGLVAGESEGEPREPGSRPDSPGGNAPEGTEIESSSAVAPGEESARGVDPSSASGRPARRRSRGRTYLLYGILAVLVIVASGISLDLAGLYSVAEYLPGGSTSAAQKSAPAAGAAAPSGDRGANEEAKERTDETGRSDEVDRLLEAAERSVEENRMKRAIEKLSAAKLLDPERPDTYRRLADIYEKLGQNQKAREQRRRAEALTDGGPGADEGEAESNAAQQ